MTQADTEYRNEIIDKDEVLKMARQSGFIIDDDNPVTFSLERFAKLVADVATAKEREACEKEYPVKFCSVKAFEDWCNDIRRNEREACAKIVESDPSYDFHKFACEAAYAIRARGEA